MSVLEVMLLALLVLSLPMVYVALTGKDILRKLAALDTIGAMGIAALMIFAIRSGRSIYMDIALTLAMLDFLGNLAFARYIRRWWK
jgi:multicomponent Na+:H+ antiporter subunit F